METYKKPVVASNPLVMSTVMRSYGVPFFEKLFGVDDFHVEDSLTPRKKSAE